MRMQLMVGINHCTLPINVTLPLLACYEYCKKLTVRNRVVPFLWRVLVQHVCNRVQITIVAMLQLPRPNGIVACISVNGERLTKVR